MWGWLNPWGKVKALERDLYLAQRQLDILADAYDKMRESNAELRRALDLYRGGQ